MKNGKHLVMLIALLLFVSACGKGQKSFSKADLVTPSFPTPPEMVVEPEARANYIVDHVWDGIEVLDSASFLDYQQMNLFLMDYFDIAYNANKENFNQSVKQLFTIATPVMDSLLFEFGYNNMLYPNSPVFNQEKYFDMMSIADELKLLDEAQKIRLEDSYKIFLKNRPGTVAEDFAYITPDGAEKTLHTTERKGLLLLIFYNPTCGACERNMEYFSSQEWVKKAVDDGDISILYMYAEDDAEAWRAKLNKIPEYASVGMDHNYRIMSERIYDLLAMPTMYLIDKDNKVILKDLFPNQLEEYLINDSKSEE